MNFDQFTIGFWHPFGAHGQESPGSIIERKRKEIAVNNWTLWSFQFRHTLDAWHREILAKGQPRVFVFCSDSKGATDPGREGSSSRTVDCNGYKLVGDPEWRPIPSTIRVPHPFRPNRTEVSAFVVNNIFHPIERFPVPPLEWISENRNPSWSATSFSTRGETMIRPGGSIPMRRVRAILELEAPYLALVRVKPSDELSESNSN